MTGKAVNDSSISIAVGRRIYALRNRRRWSQETLAGFSGLSQMTIGRYERGTAPITIDALVPLADALQVDIGRLINPESGSHAKG